MAACAFVAAVAAAAAAGAHRSAEALGVCDSEQSVCPAPCADTATAFGGLSCESLKGSMGCTQILALAPSDCPCTCAGSQAHTAGECPDAATSTPCYSSLAQWQIDAVLKTHNELRAFHGACPLTWDDDIAEYGLNSTGFQETCTSGDLTHNPFGVYGENLGKIKTQALLHDWDPSGIVSNWYCNEEGCWDGATASNTGGGDTGHMTQLLWKATKRVGCGLCNVKIGSFADAILICNYLEPGNVGKLTGGLGTKYETNVGKNDTAASGCFDTAAPGTSPPSTGSPDTTPPDTGSPDTSAPSTGPPNTSPPSTSPPDTESPATGSPATSAPSTGVPGAVSKSPDTSSPDTDSPGTDAPVTGSPVTSAPTTTTSSPAPQTESPLTEAPSSASPATASPVQTSAAPPSGAPATTSPQTVAPGVSTAPDTTSPTFSPPTSTPTRAPSTNTPTETIAPGASFPSTFVPASLNSTTNAPSMSPTSDPDPSSQPASLPSPGGNSSGIPTECDADPCGEQNCTDPTGYDIEDDYLCFCNHTHRTERGRPVAGCLAANDDDSWDPTFVILVIVGVLAVGALGAAGLFISLRNRQQEQVALKNFFDLMESCEEQATEELMQMQMHI